MILTALGRQFRRLTYSTEPAGFALLVGDASLVSGLRQIHVLRAWRVYSATEFDFREKNRALVWGRSEPRRCRQPPTLQLYYVGKMKQTIFLETSCAY